MRNVSSIKSKRKRQQLSIDSNPSPTQKGTAISHPLVELDAPVSPINIEYEGVATNSKRIKLTAQRNWGKRPSGAFESVSHPELVPGANSAGKLRTVEPEATWDVDSDLEERELKILSEERGLKRGASSDREFEGRIWELQDHSYKYRSPITQDAATSTNSRRDTMAAKERRTVGVSSLEFKPRNTLSSKNNSIHLPRHSNKKAFDLHQDTYDPPSGHFHAAKRQKLGQERTDRRESSGSVVDLSGDNSPPGAVPSLSSSGPSIPKMLKSVGSQRKHYLQSALGGVEEYRNMEDLVGFNSEKPTKALISQLNGQRHSFDRGGSGTRSEQNKATIDLSSPGLNKRHRQESRDGDKSIQVDDAEPDEIEEVAQAPARYVGTANPAAVRPKALRSRSFYRQKNISGRVHATSKNSPYFRADRKSHVRGDRAAVDAVSDELLRNNIRDQTRVFGSSFGDPQPLGSAVDRTEYLDDNLDLLYASNLTWVPDLDPERENLSRSNLEKFSSLSKSKSVVATGDTPSGGVARLKPNTLRKQPTPSTDPEMVFNVIHLLSGPEKYSSSSGYEPWQLEYNYEKKVFDLVVNGELFSERYPYLVLKPDKILKIKFNDKSTKIVILRAKEAIAESTANLLVETQTLNDAGNLVNCLQWLNNTVKLIQVEREQLDKIFSRQVSEAENMWSRIGRHKADDITLMEAHEARHAKAQEEGRAIGTSVLEVVIDDNSRTANMGRRRSGTIEDESLPQKTRRKSVAEMMEPQYSDEVRPSAPSANATLLEMMDPSSTRITGLRRTGIFGTSRPVTRATTALHSDEPYFLQRASRSASPIRWTIENPNWKEKISWKKPVVFPAKSKRRATVDARDIERLDEGEFLNDNLIEFFLFYLEDGLKESDPELAGRIYIQTSFFYTSLTKGKVRSNNINYDSVKRWNPKVDIFSYDYIIVPVCEKLHWYVAIICNAPKLLYPEVHDIENAKHDMERNLEHVESAEVLLQKDGEDELEASDQPGIEGDSITAVVPEYSGKAGSASPSVIIQVEHMSLEDDNEDWPESDAAPKLLQRGRVQLLNPKTQVEPNVDLSAPSSANKSDDTRPKGRRLKRKSIPPSRKYDPSDPRIITLDSLGGAHSPTCSNLREYLVCEAKARHDIDISPGHLGMTAKGLPQQDNYCDCGIFVLGYMEKFFADPDSFVYDILQGNMAGKMDWADMKAPKMRERIRETLLYLQYEQVQKDNEQRDERSKARPTLKPDAESTKLREPSNGAPQLDSETSSAGVTQFETERDAHNAHDSESFRAGIKLRSRVVDTEAEYIKQSTPSWKRDMSSPAMSDEESTPPGELKPSLMERSNAKKWKGAPDNSSTKAGTTEIINSQTPIYDLDIVEARDQPASTASPRRSKVHRRDSPKEVLSMLDRISSTSNPLRSSTHNTPDKSPHNSIFKKFAKQPPRSSPRKAQANGSSQHDPFEIFDSQETGELEVRETPPRQIRREDSFEDLSEPKPKTLSSPPAPRITHKHPAQLDDSPEITASRIISRTTRWSPRQSEWKDLSPSPARSMKVMPGSWDN